MDSSQLPVRHIMLSVKEKDGSLTRVDGIARGLSKLVGTLNTEFVGTDISVVGSDYCSADHVTRIH